MILASLLIFVDEYSCWCSQHTRLLRTPTTACRDMKECVYITYDNGRRHSMGKKLRPIGKDEFARMPWNLNLHPEKNKNQFP